MIEKLKEHDIIDPKTDKVIGTIGCDLREIMDKLNEVIDATNRHKDIIRQIGEWGSSKGECLWCDTLTEFNPEKPQKETFVSIDEALKMGKQDHKIRSTNERLRRALDCAVSALETISAMAAPDSSIETYARCKRIEINALTKGGDNE